MEVEGAFFGQASLTIVLSDRDARRVEQAVAFVALLELRKGGEVSLDQASPLAPIRVRRGRQESPVVAQKGAA